MFNLEPKFASKARTDGAGTAVQDKRCYERVSFLCKLQIAAIPSGPPYEARSLDLSLGGVGLVTQGSFERGQMVNVSFFFRDAENKEALDQVTGRVAHAAADIDANRIGLEFTEPLNEIEHPKLLEKLMSI